MLRALGEFARLLKKRYSMELLNTLALVAMLVSALAIIVLVLMQHGKGADMGAAFGSGASGSLFGATGSANFLSRATAIAAVVFFSSLMVIGFFHSSAKTELGVMGGVSSQSASPIPGGADKSKASGSVIPE